jgi:hypothetical protein
MVRTISIDCALRQYNTSDDTSHSLFTSHIESSPPGRTQFVRSCFFSNSHLNNLVAFPTHEHYNQLDYCDKYKLFAIARQRLSTINNLSQPSFEQPHAIHFPQSTYYDCWIIRTIRCLSTPPSLVVPDVLDTWVQQYLDR